MHLITELHKTKQKYTQQQKYTKQKPTDLKREIYKFTITVRNVNTACITDTTGDNHYA